MTSKRKNYNDIEKNILYNEVDGLCPMCCYSLHYSVDGKEQKSYEIAHIYPLNPTPDEIEILKNEEKLFKQDSNELENLLALCKNCHGEYDNPKTIESYRKMLSLKRKIIENDKIAMIYSKYSIEEELIVIINRMNCNLLDKQEDIKYDLIKIENKISKDNFILRNRVKTDVTNYYIIIRKLFAEMDKGSQGIFNTIAAQIKAFYIDLSRITKNQDEIYEHIAIWLKKKIKYGSSEPYKIIVSFFIQDCEVFSDVSE